MESPTATSLQVIRNYIIIASFCFDYAFYYICNRMTGKKFIKFISLLFAMWYLLCIVGFDVHTCGHSGKNFVSSLLMQIDLDSTSGDNLCSRSGCCKDGNCVCSGQDGISSRCSDNYFTLSAPAISRSDDEQHAFHTSCSGCHFHYPAEALILFRLFSSDSLISPFLQGHTLFRWPDIKDIQSVFSVWRI